MPEGTQVQWAKSAYIRRSEEFQVRRYAGTEGFQVRRYAGTEGLQVRMTAGSSMDSERGTQAGSWAECVLVSRLAVEQGAYLYAG